MIVSGAGDALPSALQSGTAPEASSPNRRRSATSFNRILSSRFPDPAESFADKKFQFSGFASFMFVNYL
jgi:hypothetical protein